MINEKNTVKLPEKFLERMEMLLGEEFSDFIKSYETDRVQGLRFNPLKGDTKELFAQYQERFGLTPVSWCQEGYYYDNEKRPGKHGLHEAGLYYIQEPSAMAVTELLDPKPGERILDLCAAPGGKTTHIGGRMDNQGILVSNEIHPARAKILSRNVERMGLGNCVVTNEDSGRLKTFFPEFFDKMVVDAPCSGEGMFRKDELAREQWSPENVIHCAKRQQEILDNAASMLKPGGRLVYSTCTFAPEEDEQAVELFLKNHPEFSVEKAAEGSSVYTLSQGRPEWTKENTEAVKDTFRIWPHKSEGEGHYLACLKKQGGFSEKIGKDKKESRGKKACAELSLLKKMWKDLLTEEGREHWEKLCTQDRIALYGEQLYLLPEGMPELSGIRVLRPGLHLATVKKNRLEPAHGLALVLKPEELCRKLSFDGESVEIQAYLAGNTLQAEGAENGWTLICADGFPLGWAKAASGVMKNHYPKGLRQ